MILHADHIKVRYGRNEILSDANLMIEKSGLYGLVGENGSGKSTLLKVLIGQLRPKNGLVVLNGKFGYCPQDPLVFPELTVDENFRYFAAAYGLELDWSSERDHLLAQFNFEDYLDQRVGELSGGTRQKLNLSIALLHDPEILILDEPYSGFDWETYLRFWDHTNAVIERGRTILIVTHFLNEEDRFDKIFHLKHGRVV